MTITREAPTAVTNSTNDAPKQEPAAKEKVVKKRTRTSTGPTASKGTRRPAGTNATAAVRESERHYPEPIRHWIRELRVARFMSQEALAKRAGIARETLSEYEGGRREPRAETMKRIADALGIVPAWRVYDLPEEVARILITTEQQKAVRPPAFPAHAGPGPSADQEREAVNKLMQLGVGINSSRAKVIRHAFPNAVEALAYIQHEYLNLGVPADAIDLRREGNSWRVYCDQLGLEDDTADEPDDMEPELREALIEDGILAGPAYWYQTEDGQMVPPLAQRITANWQANGYTVNPHTARLTVKAIGEAAGELGVTPSAEDVGNVLELWATWSLSQEGRAAGHPVNAEEERTRIEAQMRNIQATIIRPLYEEAQRRLRGGDDG